MAKGTATAFQTSGDLLKALSTWWGNRPERTEKEIAGIISDDDISEIGSNITQVITTSNEKWNELQNSLIENDRKIYDFMKSLNSKELNLTERLNISEKELASVKRNASRIQDPIKREEFLNTSINLESIIERTREELENVSNQRRLVLYFKGFLDKNGHANALQFVIENPNVSDQISPLAVWANKAEPLISKINKVHKATSKNIYDDRKFTEEYLKQIRPLADDNEYKQLWTLNPYNTRKLSALQVSDRRFKELLAKSVAGEDVRVTITLGETVSEISQALKLGLAGTSLVNEGMGAVQVYKWFNVNIEPNLIKARNFKSNLEKIRLPGHETIIAGRLQDSLDSINNIIKSTNTAMRSLAGDPKKTVPMYFDTVTENLAELNRQLGTWQNIVEGSRNKYHARKTGKILQQYVSDTYKIMNELGKKMNLSDES